MHPRVPEFSAQRLDIQAFARAGATLQGDTPVASLERLSSAAHGADEGRTVAGSVHWATRGEVRERLGAAPQVWLHVEATTRLPMTCQRCLQSVDEPLHVERWFRFVNSENEAAEQDTEAEEDLLVLQRRFNLLDLIEDELLLALPIIARHPVCPDPLPLGNDPPDEPADLPERPNPFAALEALKKKPKPRGH